MKKVNCGRNRKMGFTLIELMITVAIVGILASIAIPAYREQIAKGRRTQAKAVLLQAQQWMERFYSENYRYDQNVAGTDVNDTTTPLFKGQFSTAPQPGEGTAAYTITVTATSRTYTVTAARLTIMSSDKCGDYRVTQTGRKSVVNYASSYASSLEASRSCWQ